jgi:hypothetical protein
VNVPIAVRPTNGIGTELRLPSNAPSSLGLPNSATIPGIVIPTNGRLQNLNEIVPAPPPPVTEPFVVEGDGARVECQPAQLFGRGAEEKTKDVAYEAPPGFKIVNTSVSSVVVSDVSAVNGRIGPVKVSEDGKKLTVTISCRGGGVGQGRGWQQIRIQGTIQKQPA